MVTEAREYTDEAWDLRKKAAENTIATPSRIIDEGKRNAQSLLEKRFEKRKTEEIDLQSMYLWCIPEKRWQGPMNLTAPGELKRFLTDKRDSYGQAIFAMEPSTDSPAPVVVQATEVDPQRSGRKRSHRGKRRRH